MTAKQDALEVAATIRAFLEGTGSDWDWDDFTSLPLRDPQLDSIRKQALAVDLPLGPEGEAALQALANEAERIGEG